MKGRAAEDTIRNIVEEFFTKSEKINGKTVLELENKIKNEVKMSKGKPIKTEEIKNQNL